MKTNVTRQYSKVNQVNEVEEMNTVSSPQFLPACKIDCRLVVLSSFLCETEVYER